MTKPVERPKSPMKEQPKKVEVKKPDPVQALPEKQPEPVKIEQSPQEIKKSESEKKVQPPVSAVKKEEPK